MTDLTPEARAAIEEVLARHVGVMGLRRDWCAVCGMKMPCPDRQALSALLPPPEPTVEVTDEMVVDLYDVLWPFESDDGREYAQRLANSRLCPAAWLPEDERVTELREAAADLIAWAGNDVVADRLRAALQALDDTEAPK